MFFFYILESTNGEKSPYSDPSQTENSNERCTSPEPDSGTEKAKSYSRFSFRRRSSNALTDTTPDKTEKRKHSISQYFGFRKHKDKLGTPPDSPRATSPVPDPNRRGSADSVLSDAPYTPNSPQPSKER